MKGVREREEGDQREGWGERERGSKGERGRERVREYYHSTHPCMKDGDGYKRDDYCMFAFKFMLKFKFSFTADL